MIPPFRTEEHFTTPVARPHHEHGGEAHPAEIKTEAAPRDLSAEPQAHRDEPETQHKPRPDKEMVDSLDAAAQQLHDGQEHYREHTRAATHRAHDRRRTDGSV